MLSLLSSLSPSQPLRLFVNTTGVPGVPCFPPVVGILTIQSIAVLHTNMASPALLNSTPLAPKGGTPSGGLPLFGKRVGSGPTQAVAWPHIEPLSVGEKRARPTGTPHRCAANFRSLRLGQQGALPSRRTKVSRA